MAEPQNLPDAKIEVQDVNLRLIWIGAPALIVFVVLLVLLVLWLFPGGTIDRTLRLPLPTYPAPQLQAHPRDDLARFRDQQRQQLDGLDDTMRQVAHDGIEGWPTP